LRLAILAEVPGMQDVTESASVKADDEMDESGAKAQERFQTPGPSGQALNVVSEVESAVVAVEMFEEKIDVTVVEPEKMAEAGGRDAVMMAPWRGVMRRDRVDR